MTDPFKPQDAPSTIGRLRWRRRIGAMESLRVLESEVGSRPVGADIEGAIAPLRPRHVSAPESATSTAGRQLTGP